MNGDGPRHLVLGGGLAGLAAAWELARADEGAGASGGRGSNGSRIVVVERLDVLGGKARSADGPAGAGSTDKGYHIFPFWYWDLWHLLRDTGLVAEDEHAACRKGQPCADTASRFSCPHEPASRDYVMVRVDPDEQVRAGTADLSPRTAGSLLSMLLVMVGLVGADRLELDRRTLEDHLQGRWYAGNATRQRLREVVLKALANPSHDASALTTANTFRRWVPVYREANWRALRGPMDAELIEPLRHALEGRGVEFRTGTEVRSILVGAGGDGPASVQEVVLGPSGDTAEELIDVRGADVVCTLPHTVLPGLLDWGPGGPPTPDDRPAEPPVPDPSGRDTGPGQRIRGLRKLGAAPMAALDLYVSELPEIGGKPFPRAHFSLIGSRYAITGFDASALWRGEHLAAFPAGAHHLVQFVCSDVESLVGLSEADAERMLRADIVRFLPEFGSDAEEPGRGGRVVATRLLLNDDPSDMVTRNEAGGWPHRPPADVGIANLWMGGDFCRVPVDVASMEAAVSSGMLAARAALGVPAAVGADRSPDEPVTCDRPRNRWRGVVRWAGLVGTVVSALFQVLFLAVAFPYRVGRRCALDGLGRSLSTRRRRDRVMALAGPLGLIAGLATFALLFWGPGSLGVEHQPGDPLLPDQIADPWWVVVLGGATWALLGTFLVPVRRFLGWSRQTGGGLLLSAAGFLALAVLVAWAEGLSTVAWWLLAPVLAACLTGPVWSVVAARFALEYEEPRFRLLRRVTVISWAAWPYALALPLVFLAGWLGTGAPVAAVVVAVIAAVVATVWIGGLTVFLLRDDGPAPTVPGSKGPPVPRTSPQG